MASRVRELQAADLPSVVALHEEVARSRGETAAPDLRDRLERTLLDHPWSDPSAPSFVHEAADGAITAFVASYPVRLRVDGRPALAVASGGLVASPRAPGTGGLVLRRQLAGPQELSLTDGATEASRNLWSALGGQPLLHGAIGWRWKRQPTPPDPAEVRPAVGVRAGAPVADTLGTARREIAYAVAAPASDPATREEVLTPDALLDAVTGVGLRVRPDYDRAYLTWLFGRLDDSTAGGPVVRHLVTSVGSGRPVGWYVYRAASSGAADVLALVGRGGRVGRVLDHLLADAAGRGVREMRGRLEPACAEVLNRPGFSLRRTPWSMVRTRDPLLLAHLGAPTTALSRLDGDTWHGRRSG